jgi:Polyketide cyclase / dehydrase and lipid transport
MDTGTRRLTGTLTVALPPDEAFRLFTPRGERDWVAHWEPRFPAATPDDTEPGTVFQTGTADHAATWLVLDRDPGRRIRYARVVPGRDAGTVTVRLAGDGDRSEVTVAYELTALSEAGRAHLADFAAGYPAFLASWQDAIAAALRRPPGPR